MTHNVESSNVIGNPRQSMYEDKVSASGLWANPFTSQKRDSFGHEVICPGLHIICEIL